MKKTKRALFSSVVALILCFSMLLGTTFAWFTDEVSSGKNQIVAGNLDIELYWSDDAATWHRVDEKTNIFKENAKWEPGYTEVVYLKIVNEGSLALKYQLGINVAGETGSVNVLGEEFKLSQHIRFGVAAGEKQFVNRNAAVEAVDATATALNQAYTSDVAKLASKDEQIVTLVVYMPTSVGNEANHAKGAPIPTINLGIRLQATQVADEMDSFDGNYDAGATFPEIEGGDVTLQVTTENGLTTAAFSESADGLTLAVPAGVKTTGNTLSLTVDEMATSGANITVFGDQMIRPLDVHVAGVAGDNTQPMTVTIEKALMPGLNLGNYKLFHVEANGTNEMTLVAADATFDAHNQFKYDPATGDVVLYMATFSEVALVADTENAWEGKFDYSWYDADATELTIANADQLAAFGAIVGGMDGQTRDSFAGKTVKLIADINLGDKESENNPDIIFYPIGYYNSEGTYERTNTAITSGLRNFEGTFDGNGHTVSNFYHNTWEMKGDHNWYDATLQYYRDGMGLFGRVYGGTVKNLTVKNFSSDGEITTTGVIAAYADGATFENIAIFDCNPRVYNIGNGGIVGCVGWYAKEANLKTTFKNITVDNSNKISALWGSYDVACGGIVGQYYPTSGQTSAGTPKNAGIHFENCHISAVMDVYNDVCANYQYYAYRYTGMLIGSVRENETINGHVYPKMDGITAKDCTVHFGDWNDYYYCELVANSLASYTHDHQMSRLEQVASVDVENMKVTDLDGKTTDIPTSGRVNYVVVKAKDANGMWIHGDGHNYAECYHFVNGVQHFHDVADADNPNPTETVNGVEGVLKEDKQLIYREFNQLFTGYGWGVTSKGLTDFEGVENMDITAGDHEASVEKFEGKVAELANNKEYKIADIFNFVDNGVELIPGALAVSVTNLAENNPVSATIVYDRYNWENGTITLTGTGKVQITIQDYYFCTPTTIEVTVTEREPAEKFDIVMNNGDFLHRVGNSGTVALDKLFKAKDGVTVGTVSVTVEAVNGTAASGTYSNNAIRFSGTGVVKVTITDNDYCTPTVLYLEVVDATNVTSLSGTISGNVVLLNDCGLSSLTVSGRNAVYGNGFTATYTGVGQYLNNGLKMGVVNVSENGTLDNLRIKASIYPSAYLFYSEAQNGPKDVDGDKNRYHYQLSAVAATGNATIQNCYIYGGRTNIYIGGGNVTVKNSILECGTLANSQIISSNEYTVTFENVTTIQHQVNATVGDTNKVMLGAAILVGDGDKDNTTATAPAIALKGNFKQYNWVTDADKNAVSDSNAQMIIGGALGATAYNHTINGTAVSNMGIIYLNDWNKTDVKVTNNTGMPYEMGTVSLTLYGVNVGRPVYSVKDASDNQIYSDYENADRSTANGLYQPQFKYDGGLGGQYIEKTDDGDEFCYLEDDTIKIMFPAGDTKEIDLAAFVNIVKYAGQDLGLVIKVMDSDGKPIAVNNNKVILSAEGTYAITYEVTDNLFYDVSGNVIANQSKVYSWNVTIDVALKDTAIPNAYFEFDSSKQVIYRSGGNSNIKQFVPFLAGLKIYDYNGQTAYLRFDGDNDFNKIAKASINNINTSGEAQGYHIVTIELTDGGKIVIDMDVRANSGSSTHSGSLKVRNNVLYVVNGGTTSGKGQTWKIYSYKFVGNNGTEINSGLITFGTAGVDCSTATTPSSNFGTTVKYTVTYNANEGNCGQTIGYATSAATAVTLPTPTRSGYIFAGWYTAASGGTSVGGAGDSYTPSANITLYAQWGKPCAVTYNANGGSCGTASEKYTGTALTLPTPTRDGYWFVGWYDAATGGSKIGDAGATYNPIGEITLYAHWQEAIEYTVTYNANGGTCGTASATYQGTTLTLPTPTRTGYKFLGWYTAASGGTKIDDAGASYTPSANITLYAQWEQISYTITISKQNNATVTVDKTTAHYNDTISVTVSFSQSNSKTLTVKDASGNTVLSKSAAGTYTFTMPASNVTIEASSSGSCVTADTLITLADGTQKRIDQVTYADKLLVWDFFKGQYTAVAPAIIFDHGYDNNTIIELKFNDGTSAKVVNLHQFFDATLNKYVSIDADSVADYVGHKFAKMNGEGYEQVTLVDYTITEEYCEAWGIISAEHYNIFVEGMLSTDFMKEDFALFNYFEVGQDMRFDEEKMQTAIEQYGLYTYEDFAEYLTYEQFVAFNVPYFKVAVGKGDYTYEGIIALIETYLHN